LKTVTYSRLLSVAGALTMLYSRWMPVSIDGSDFVNVHLISERQNILIIGCVLFIGGIILQAAFNGKGEGGDDSKEASENKIGIQAGLVLRHLNSKAIGFLVVLKTNWKWVLARLIFGFVAALFIALPLSAFLCRFLSVFGDSCIQHRRDIEDAAGLISFVLGAYAFRTKPILFVIRNLLLVYVAVIVALQMVMFVTDGHIDRWLALNIAAVLALMTAAGVQYWIRKKRGDTA
jgi:hypothetical protein